jgi:ketosteroid isomerase-like protein
MEGESNMNPSAEIKDAMLRVYAAHASGDASASLRLFSRQEGVLAIGTDPNEWWAGFDTIAQVFKAQLPEMGGKIQVKAGDLHALAEGTVGWAADCPTMQALGQEIPMRVTAVFHQEDGAWKIVQYHVSIGVLNTEALGKELTPHGTGREK